MTSVSVELSHACQGCGQPVAVNAVLPRVRCDRCGRSAELDARIWKLILDEPLREGPGLSAREERTAGLVTDAGRFQIVYRLGRGTCSHCQAPILRERARAAAGSHVHACGCGMRTPCRAVPPELGLEAVEILREEDHELLWPVERKEAAALKCSGCGGAQEVGAATPRLFACRFCTVQCYVPDDLWSLLHPVRAIRPWVLELRDEAADGSKKKRGARGSGGSADPTRLPAFSDVKDLVVGPDGMLYAVLEL